jgi:hypothetical protein
MIDFAARTKVRIATLAACIAFAVAFCPAYSLAQNAPPAPQQPAPREENPSNQETPQTDPPPATAPDEPAAPTTTAPAEPLPDAQRVLDDAIQAVGGKTAIEAVKSITMKATLATDRGEVHLELFSAKPDKALVLRHDSHGETSLGSNGAIGWLKPAQGELQILDEMQSDHVQRQSNVYRVLLNIRDDYRDFQTVDHSTFDGVDVHKIKMIDHRGKLQFAIFEVESKLIKALLIPEDTPEGERIVIVRFADWKKHGDILGFTKATIENEKVSVLTIKEVEFNTVDPAVFEPSNEVKALAAEKAANIAVPATQPVTPPQSAPDDSEEDPDVDEDEEDVDDETDDDEKDEDEGGEEPEEDEDDGDEDPER